MHLGPDAPPAGRGQQLLDHRHAGLIELGAKALGTPDLVELSKVHMQRMGCTAFPLEG